MGLLEDMLRGQHPAQQAIKLYRKLRQGNLPKLAERYVDSIVKETGLPRNVVKRSRPVKNFISKLLE